MQFMHLPSRGESLLGRGHPKLKDCKEESERSRGNLPLARLDAKPQDRDMTQEQWCAFAALRAFPCLQIRSLSGGLAQKTLVLDSPEVRVADLSECAVLLLLGLPLLARMSLLHINAILPASPPPFLRG